MVSALSRPASLHPGARQCVVDDVLHAENTRVKLAPRRAVWMQASALDVNVPYEHRTGPRRVELGRKYPKLDLLRLRPYRRGVGLVDDVSCADARCYVGGNRQQRAISKG
jgi:hypothetical protein